MLNKRQQLLILLMLSKLSMIGTFYFGFWTFIYEIGYWQKPLWLAVMSSAVSLVLAVLCFLAWIVTEMWLRDPSTMPTFKLELGKLKHKTENKSTGKPEEKTEKRLPLY